MNKYEELIYSLIHNCNRKLTDEEMQILNQASAIYNTYNQLTEQIGCPLDIYAKLVYNTPVYDKKGYKFFINTIKKYEVCCYGKQYVQYAIDAIYFSKEEGVKNVIRSFSLENYKKTWWLKEDRSE